MPPRHGKSTLCSHYFPAWYLGNYPDRQIILASYEASFAASWGRKSRDCFRDYAPSLFGQNLSKTVAATAMWGVEGNTGLMGTAGMGGSVTGKGAHVFIIEDPIKNAEAAYSANTRQSHWDWFQSTAYTRLESDPEGAIIVILTRWHEDDIAGRLIAEMGAGGEQWEIINFPAIAEENDILGRVPGQPLWPQKFPLERLENIRRVVGSYWFDAMYQQHPRPADGAIFKQDWLKYWPTKKPLPIFDQIIQIWDTAQEEGKLNDYSACATFGIAGGQAWLLHVFRDKMETPRLLRAIRSLAERWDADLILIEKASSGASAIQTLKRELKIPILPTKARGDKVFRAHQATPALEADKVWICKGSWLPMFESELLAFPLAANDDMVDVFVYGLLRIFKRSNGKVRQN